MKMLTVEAKLRRALAGAAAFRCADRRRAAAWRAPAANAPWRERVVSRWRSCKRETNFDD